MASLNPVRRTRHHDGQSALSRIALLFGGEIVLLYISGFLVAVLSLDNSVTGTLVYGGACVVVGAYVLRVIRSWNGFAATMAGLVAGALAFPALLYGSYTAYVVGLSGLDVRSFGTDDYRGQPWIAIMIIVWTVPMMGLGAILAFLGWIISGRPAERR